MKQVLTVAGLVAGALLLATLLVVGGGLAGSRSGDAPAATSPLSPPWQVEQLPEGASRVAGLVLGGSAGPGAQGQTAGATLAEVQALWPQQLEVAVVAAPGELGTLEALVDPAQLGGIAGKLVVSLAATPGEIERLKAGAAKVAFMESTTRKFTLSADDLDGMRHAPVTALAFVPQAQLDEDTVRQRFGVPAQRVDGAGGVRHHLYPALGLDVAINPKGKDVLQYVAPAQFEQRLRAPLKAARGTSATPPTLAAQHTRPPAASSVTPPAAPPAGTAPTAR